MPLRTAVLLFMRSDYLMPFPAADYEQTQTEPYMTHSAGLLVSGFMSILGTRQTDIHAAGVACVPKGALGIRPDT